MSFLTFFAVASQAQGRGISRAPKITTPYVTENGDTLAVNTVIQLLDPTGDNNEYKYVQLLNNFNEPIQPANSRAAFQKQPIKFFKESDGVMYLFTKYFCVNIDAALFKNEIKIVKKK